MITIKNRRKKEKDFDVKIKCRGTKKNTKYRQMKWLSKLTQKKKKKTHMEYKIFPKQHFLHDTENKCAALIIFAILTFVKTEQKKY